MKIPRAPSEGEETLALHIRAERLPAPQREYAFTDARHWRTDFAWPDRKLAAEVEGGTWAGGRHSRGDGFTRDCEKYNALALLGWRLLRFTTEMVRSGYAIGVLRQVLGGK